MTIASGYLSTSRMVKLADSCFFDFSCDLFSLCYNFPKIIFSLVKIIVMKDQCSLIE